MVTSFLITKMSIDSFFLFLLVVAAYMHLYLTFINRGSSRGVDQLIAASRKWDDVVNELRRRS